MSTRMALSHFPCLMLLVLAAALTSQHAHAQDLMGIYRTKDGKHMITLNGTPGSPPTQAIFAGVVKTDEGTRVLLSGFPGCLTRGNGPGQFNFSGFSKETDENGKGLREDRTEKGRVLVARTEDGAIKITTTDITHFDGKEFFLDKD